MLPCDEGSAATAVEPAVERGHTSPQRGRNSELQGPSRVLDVPGAGGETFNIQHRTSNIQWAQQKGDRDSRVAEQGVDPPVGIVNAAPEIQALTRAVRRGDADAFARFYDLYSFRLYKFLLVLAHGDEQQAREVCQAVLIKLAKRCDVFADEQRLWAWLCVLARNTFLDHWRARKRLGRFVPLDELSADQNMQPNPEHRLRDLLNAALAIVPPDERELIQAVYLDKRPLQELADESGQTYKAIESRLGRLRQKLKEHVLKDLRHENEC
jgi:RNA polymerase sigma-70 factor, ECF subfamily